MRLTVRRDRVTVDTIEALLEISGQTRPFLTLAFSGLSFYFRGLDSEVFRNCFALSQILYHIFRVSSFFFEAPGDFRVRMGFRFGSRKLYFDLSEFVCSRSVAWAG
jgi:hypothetical protein